MSLGMEISKIKMTPFNTIRDHVINGIPIRGMVSLSGIMLNYAPVDPLCHQIASRLNLYIALLNQLDKAPYSSRVHLDSGQQVFIAPPIVSHGDSTRFNLHTLVH
jgi:hypothetical protein